MNTKLFSRISLVIALTAGATFAGTDQGTAQPAKPESAAKAKSKEGANVPAPDERKKSALWSLEAQSVAHALKITGKPAEQMVAAYLAARAEYAAAVGKHLEKDKADRDPAAMGKIKKDSGEKLAEALKPILGAEQSEKAMLSLGSFNPAWDFLVQQVSDMKLEGSKLSDALGYVAGYIADLEVIRQKAGGSKKPDAEKVKALKAKLDGNMKTVLSAAQYEQWTGGGKAPAAKADKAAKAEKPAKAK